MRTPLTVRLTSAVVALVLGAAGCSAPVGGGTADSSGQAPSASPAARAQMLWPAPPDPMKRTVEAGLKPEPKEYLVNHVHAHLDVFVDGMPIAVPAGIGINTDDPEVRTFNEADGSVGYGGIKLCSQPCISPLHTHGEDGIIHTESSTPEPNSLGEFFTEWGVRLSESCIGEKCSPTPIAIYVDGERYEGDPSVIKLTDRKEIAIVIGTPPAQIPATADFSNG